MQREHARTLGLERPRSDVVESYAFVAVVAGQMASHVVQTCLTRRVGIRFLPVHKSDTFQPPSR